MTVDEAKSMLEQFQDEGRLVQSIQTAFDNSSSLSLPDGRYIGRKEELEMELIKHLDPLILEKGKIIETILNIPDMRFRAILMEHYINGKQWEQIADQFQVARQTVCKKWLTPALEAFANIYGKEGDSPC